MKLHASRSERGCKALLTPYFEVQWDGLGATKLVDIRAAVRMAKSEPGGGASDAPQPFFRDDLKIDPAWLNPPKKIKKKKNKEAEVANSKPATKRKRKRAASTKGASTRRRSR